MADAPPGGAGTGLLPGIGDCCTAPDGEEVPAAVALQEEAAPRPTSSPKGTTDGAAAALAAAAAEQPSPRAARGRWHIPEQLLPYAIVNSSYLLFTVTDGAVRMLVLMQAHELGFEAWCGRIAPNQGDTLRSCDRPHRVVSRSWRQGHCSDVHAVRGRRSFYQPPGWRRRGKVRSLRPPRAVLLQPFPWRLSGQRVAGGQVGDQVNAGGRAGVAGQRDGLQLHCAVLNNPAVIGLQLQWPCSWPGWACCSDGTRAGRRWAGYGTIRGPGLQFGTPDAVTTR